MLRPERLEDQIQFLLSTLIQREVRDPDLGFLTLTAVRLSGDRGVAKIYYTVMPLAGENEEATTARSRKALGRAAGFLRTQLAARLKLRRVPELRFFPDATLEEGNKMEDLFAELEKERASRPPVEEPAPDEQAADGDTQS
jgi:ribosome-binding factor A